MTFGGPPVTDQQLRERLVEHLERTRVLTDPHVEAAVLHTPRHRFIPDIPLPTAYEDRALPIKERGGEIISSISQPSMIVQMLQLLCVQPGDSILEIGTGSGYNAALLVHLTGPTGRVLTVDIEPDLIEMARTRFADLGFANVRVEDARTLSSLSVPFDRIVVTARADDIQSDWWRLLKETGRMVIPLEIGYAGERAVGFAREGGLLRSTGSYACAFIEMRTPAPRLEGDVFFPNRRARYGMNDTKVAPRSIVAMRRDEAASELVEHADVIVARPDTIFAFRL